MSQTRATPPFPEFAPIRALRTSERVARAIRRSILEGRFAPGETLPPERTLAEQFQVTRNTVRDALRQLEGLRLVAIRHGSGAVARDFRQEAGLELLATFLEDDALSGEVDGAKILGDIARARAILGQAMIHACIDGFERGALPALQAATRAFEAEATSGAPEVSRLQLLEIELHRVIVQGGGNLAFTLLYNSLTYVYRRVLPLFTWVVEDPAALAALYRRATDALAAGDAAAARAAFTELFERPPFLPVP
ncbi:MAG: GntR family transcriptional regulator [Deltaproteobacteria bacterium]|nr:GntR family transcriptional regulator [Deltaproteobacteria bacterium]